MKSVLFMAIALCGLGVWFVQSIENGQGFGSNQNPASSQAKSAPVIGRKYQVERENDGHFYLNASVEGRPIRFMVDSGASHVMLTSQDAKRLGRFIKKQDLVHEFHTANGVNMAAKVTLSLLRIGGRDFAKVDAYVFPDGLSISLLGQSVLSRFAAVEMRQQQMELRW
ncbi:MAG: TIGR02281 family clan AA aspartic protease [Pseudomonadota bacterium]